MAGDPICPGCSRFKPRSLRLCRECMFMEVCNLPLPNKRWTPTVRVQEAIDEQHADEVAVQSLSDEEYLAFLDSPASPHYGQHPWPCIDCNGDTDFDRSTGFGVLA